MSGNKQDALPQGDFSFPGFFGEKGPKYNMRLLGTLHDDPGWTGPVFRHPQFGVLQIRTLVVHHEDLSIFGEINYNPADGSFSQSIGGPISTSTASARNLITRGLLLLSDARATLMTVGRPIESGFITEANKQEALNAVIKTGREIYWQDSERQVSQQAIVNSLKGRFGISNVRSLRRLITKCGKNWRKDILAQVKNHS